MSATVFYEYNIIIHEGATYDKWFRWLVDDVLVSLEDVTGIMQVREFATDDVTIFNLVSEADPWAADGASGIYFMDIGSDDRYRIYINNEDTEGICPLHENISGVYNLFLYNVDGECILKQYGTASLIAAVARPAV